jgi:hypothetical protein
MHDAVVIVKLKRTSQFHVQFVLRVSQFDIDLGIARCRHEDKRHVVALIPV